MRWRKRERIRGRSRSYESWARRVDHHQATVSAARTPDRQLAAAFDRFRASASKGRSDACPAMARMLVDQAAEWHHYMMGNLAERFTDELKHQRAPAGKLRVAFDWYRAEIAAARRDYGDDEEFRALAAGNMHDVATALNSAAVALEQASQPAA